MASVLSRYKGCLVGGVVGDCIGAVFECIWSGPVAIEKVLKDAVREVEAAAAGSGTKKKQRLVWEFTDDTAMARSVVRTLVENNGLNPRLLARRFSDEYHAEPQRGYGGGVISVFSQLRENKCEDVFGPAALQFEGQGSYGNGGAMRIAPAALFIHHKQMNFNQLKDMVTDITKITHTHRGALHGAILQCYAVYLALVTSKLNIDTYIDELIVKMKDLEGNVNPSTDSDKKRKAPDATDTETKDSDAVEESEISGEEQSYCIKLEKIRELVLREEEPPPNEVVEKLGTGIAAIEAVPAAIYSFLRATKTIKGIENRNAFERTVIYAISLGGDTDTIATMAGAIAGAHYGITEIPASWYKCCEGGNDALKDAENLHKLPTSDN